jgi:Transposase DDE domain group 1
MIANCWLRPGDAHTANNCEAFLADTLDRLPGKRVSLIRADSGFSANAVLTMLENKALPYIVALRMMQPLQRALVDQRGWWKLDAGIELTHFEYQAHSWSKPRRVIGIRQHLKERPDAKGKTLSLFANDPVHGQYRYAALVTDLTLSDAEVWRLYRGRADCENRIKELKYDFAADSFCLNDFWATEACLNTVMLAYNCMSLFRQAALKSIHVPSKDVQHTLTTLRYKLFAKAGYLIHEGRKDILKLAVAMHQREWLSGIWDRTKTFDLPVIFEPRWTTSGA